MDVDKKITEYRKLIKTRGIKEATEVIKNLGISYDEDFTETHKADPVFSSNIPTIMSKTSERFIRGQLLPTEPILARNAYWVTNYIQIDVDSTISQSERQKIATNVEYAEPPLIYTV